MAMMNTFLNINSHSRLLIAGYVCQQTQGQGTCKHRLVISNSMNKTILFDVLTDLKLPPAKIAMCNSFLKSRLASL